jgi:YebC/PmpR family DNA-binding regulatory protein
MVAVREGGSNPEANFRLRLAVQKARDNSMPSENIERAIKRGSGTMEGAGLVEMVLEGYGPSGAAILVQALTDNRNRTVQDIRNIFSRNGGNLGESGCVAWLFNSKGLITIRTNELNTEKLALEAIDAGAEDVTFERNFVAIYTRPEELEMVRRTLEEKSVPLTSAELSMVPKTMIELEEKPALQTLRLLDRLEELDGVQRVSSNVNFSDSVLEKYQSQT